MVLWCRPVWFLAACAADPITSVSAAPSEVISTLVEVSWTPASAEAWVEWEGQRFDGADGRAVVYGAGADATISVTVHAEDWSSEPIQVTTGSLPAAIPPVELVDAGALEPGFVATSWLESPDEGSGAIVLDEAGRVVWYDLLDDVGTISVIHKVEGGFLYLVSSHSYLPDAHAVFVSNDGREREAIPLPMAHHDVLPLPSGGFAAVVGEVREVNGENVVGDTIVEVNEDGAQTTIWNAFDHFEVIPNDGWGPLAYPEGADWNHANGLAFDEARDQYLISMFRCACVIALDRADGEIAWIVGGDDGTMGADNPFGPQHSPDWTDVGFSVFDNGYEINVSRLADYAIEDGGARLAWSWPHPDGYVTAVLGDYDRMTNGGHLSSWGTLGEVIYAGADDAVSWRVDVEPGHVLGQVDGFEQFE